MAAKQTVYHVQRSTARATAAGVRWEVEGREGRRVLREPHHTQKGALHAARERAKEHTPAQVVVHAADGHVRSAYTYGSPGTSRGGRGRRAGSPGGVY
ncbi:DUF2188 domain-containing protein [Streptomyces sp. NPDC000594]|uniref:DUF2188 domain-containing protein n=1 Tax=Streptomyces sp. NPDC000594 TaxID=3154261 RepID=UPI0033189AC8